MKRLAIYVHYDPKGRVEDYVIYCLNGLKEVVDEILVVVNGSLSDEAKVRLEEAGVDILVRENKGFDFWGWRAGLEHYGYDKIAQLEALLLTNNSYYGPIFPFSEMWNDMEKEECDFWGLTGHPEMNCCFIENNQKTKWHAHIQSYWMVFRNSVLRSDDFKAYWDGLRPYNSLQEVIGYGELQLTRYFERCGFKAKTWIDKEKYSDVIDNPFFLNDILIMNDRCPTLKRKLFSGFDGKLKLHRLVNTASELLAYLGKSNLYDTNMIWDDLLRNQHMSITCEHLNLSYTLPSVYRLPSTNNDSPSRIACIFYIYPEDLVEYCYQFATTLPADIDVYVVNTDKNVAEKSQALFGKLRNKVEYRLQQNRGRDNTALLITCKDVLQSYDFICFMHGKKSKNDAQFSIHGEEFRKHCFVSLLYNENYVMNIIETFKRNERLGLLVPLLPASFSYDFVLFNRWGPNYFNAEKFIKNDLELNLSLDPDVVAPYGGMYWARTKALKTLLSREWKFTDFPQEPIPEPDGLLTHVIERVTPLLAQHDGYYTAMTAPEFYTDAVLTTLISIPSKILQARSVIPQDILNYKKLRRRYLRYSIYSKLPFPEFRKKYTDKKYHLKVKLRKIDALIKQKPKSSQIKQS